MSSLKGLLKKYKKVPRNDSATAIPLEPILNPKQQYLHTIWKENALNSPPLEVTTLPEGLGLLFIIIDDFPHEWIWRVYLQLHAQSHPPIRVWIHAKFPDRVESPWVRNHLVNFCIRAEWGSVDLTRVMLRLLATAIDDTKITEETSNGGGKYHGTVGKFCFLSESCVPSSLPGPAMEAMADDSSSWMRWTQTPNNGYAKQGQFDKLAGAVPIECIAKADQWLLLNRLHAVDVVALVEKVRQEKIFFGGLFSLFSGVKASDEMFFPTCLGLLGYLSSDATAEAVTSSLSGETCANAGAVTKRRVTYCLWTEDSARNPTTFTSLLPPSSTHAGAQTPPHMLSLAKKEGCLFMRKLKVAETPATRQSVRRRVLEEWLSLVTDDGSLPALLRLLGPRQVGEGGQQKAKEEENDGKRMEQVRGFVEAWLRQEGDSDIDRTRRGGEGDAHENEDKGKACNTHYRRDINQNRCFREDELGPHTNGNYCGRHHSSQQRYKHNGRDERRSYGYRRGTHENYHSERSSRKRSRSRDR